MTDEDRAVPTPDYTVLTQDGIKFRAAILRGFGVMLFQYNGAFTLNGQSRIAAFYALIRKCPLKAIVIDLTDAYSIDDFGVGKLLIAGGAMAEAGKSMAILLNGRSTVQERLHSLGVDAAIPVFASLDACVQDLASRR